MRTLCCPFLQDVDQRQENVGHSRATNDIVERPRRARVSLTTERILVNLGLWVLLFWWIYGFKQLLNRIGLLRSTATGNGHQASANADIRHRASSTTGAWKHATCNRSSIRHQASDIRHAVRNLVGSKNYFPFSHLNFTLCWGRPATASRPATRMKTRKDQDAEDAEESSSKHTSP